MPDNITTPLIPAQGTATLDDNFAFNPVKFRELILYLAAGGMKDPGFGLVKLATALYYADISAYIAMGRPVTGAAYRKYQQGPAPKQLPGFL